jgi:hypothetical protein
MKRLATLAIVSSLTLSAIAAETPADDYEYVEVDANAYEEAPAAGSVEPAQSSGYTTNTNANEEVNTDEFVIPNTPLLRPSNIITIRAIGMGVAPENTISPAQALVLAKRAAIADAYRQLGEKMYGIKLNAKDTIKDAVVKSTTIRTKVNAMVRNAEIQETVYKDGLCQVEMEVKLDGRRWYRVLSGY